MGLQLLRSQPCSHSQPRLKETEMAEMVMAVVEEVVEAVVESLAASETVMVPLLAAELERTLMVLLVEDSCTKTKEKTLMFALSGRTSTSGMALMMKPLTLAPLTSMFTPKP